MSSTWMDDSVTNLLAKTSRSYLWRTGTGRSFPLVRWSAVTRSKTTGGLGIRDVATIKKSLGAPRLLPLLNNAPSLWVSYWQAKYEPLELWGKQPRAFSSCYKTVLQSAMALREGFRHQIGSGEYISLLDSPWCSVIPLSHWPTYFDPALAFSFEFVAEFIMDGEWNLQLLQMFFHPLLIQIIRAIYLPQHETEDTWVWTQSRQGHLSSKGAYHYIHDRTIDRGIPDVQWHNIWRLKVPPRIQTFIWKLAWGRLPTGALFTRQKMGPVAPCPVCRDGPDDTDHIFFSCRHARLYWTDATYRIGLPLRPSTRWAVADWSAEAGILSREIFPTITAFIAQSLWGLWKRRNLAFFQGHFESNLSLFCRAIAATREFFPSSHAGPHPSWRQESGSPPTLSAGRIDQSNPHAVCKAAWDLESLSSGAGFLIRVPGSFSIQGQRRGMAHSALQAELQSILLCLQQAVSYGIPTFQLASDCQVAVKLLRGDFLPMRSVRGLLEDIWAAAALLRSVVWVHLPRQATSLAHEAARGALGLEDHQLLIQRLPDLSSGIFHESQPPGRDNTHVFPASFSSSSSFLYQPDPGLQPPGRHCVPQEAVVPFH